MKHLKCPFNHELLSAFATGNCEPKERLVVEKHLASCRHCRQEVKALEAAWWSLDTWRDESITVQPRFNELRCRIKARPEPITLRDRMKPYLRQAGAGWRHASKFAAAAAIAAIMTAAVFQTSETGAPSGSSSPASSATLANVLQQPLESELLYVTPMSDAERLREGAERASSDAVRLQRMVAFNPDQPGYKPTSVLPPNPELSMTSLRPSAMNDGFYLGQ